jgi:L-ascorbate metabolism protein UlaG (beta-lactamase superfamily)
VSERQVTYLGHASTLIELDGITLLTDPVLRRRTAHLLRTGPLPEVGRPDAILISHGHLDHLDLGTLERLPRETLVVVPRGLGDLVGSRGFERVEEVNEGDEVLLDTVVVRATQADHAGRPAPGRSGAAVGYLISGSGTVYFAGDTDLFDGMAGLAPELDLALIPIWGWGPTIGEGHLDPVRAADALALLRPRIAVPIHWGTLRPFYRSTRAAFLSEPLTAFLAAARERAPEVDVRPVGLGETVLF